MKLLATLTNNDFGLDTKPISTAPKERQAARAVIINAKNEVSLLYTAKHEHHKLPGGGIEKNETWQKALHREAMEEAGCTIEIIRPIGKIVEEKDDERQVSICVLAKLEKDLETPDLTQKEVAEGYQPAKWFSFDNALELMNKDKPKTYMGNFMHKRDLIFLTHAKHILGNLS